MEEAARRLGSCPRHCIPTLPSKGMAAIKLFSKLSHAQSKLLSAAIAVTADMFFICRCMMHGFALIMGSIFGHSWANKTLKKCQKLVTATKASHKLRKWMRDEMALLKQTNPVKYKDLTWLVVAATTRFSSTYNCMLSVLQLQTAFNNMKDKHEAELTHKNATAGMTAVVQIINSNVFWKELESLTPIAKPFNQVSASGTLFEACRSTAQMHVVVLNANKAALLQVCQAMQGETSSLTDAGRYLMLLARTVKGLNSAEEGTFPPDFVAHAFTLFNRRWLQMATPLVKLALFLHPVYRVLSKKEDGSDDFSPIGREVGIACLVCMAASSAYTDCSMLYEISGC